jgi:hypothetical protein
MLITTRRQFLIASAPLLAAPFLQPAFANSAVSTARHDLQVGWRFCTRCSSLFWSGGGSDKAACPGGGVHSATGYVFHIPYNVPGTPNAQSDWRFCNLCFGMFWNGYPDKGKCIANSKGHRMYGFDYVLPHDIAPNANNQDKWRFCSKCKALFYDGYPTKGSCHAGGGGHVAQGYMFVLPHDLVPGRAEFQRRTELHTNGWAPVSGWTEITGSSNGDIRFSGHLHNSGAINIRCSVILYGFSPSDQVFVLTVENKRLDGTEVLFGRNRDFNWNQVFNAGSMSHRRWDDLVAARFSARISASSEAGSGIRELAANIVDEAYSALPSVPGKQALVKPTLNFLINL